jgi:hypothetical protein
MEIISSFSLFSHSFNAFSPSLLKTSIIYSRAKFKNLRDYDEDG